jgi:hypothetical protein
LDSDEKEEEKKDLFSFGRSGPIVGSKYKGYDGLN